MIMREDNNGQAPRVTLEEFEANIAHVEYVTHHTHGGQILRWAVITTKSGFAVTGAPSAAVSVENDDPDLGMKFALANAKQAMWPLMGYALKERLMAEPCPESRSKAMLRENLAQFRMYEQSHREKGTPDSLAKAERNREFADRIEKYLGIDKADHPELL
jgi:hypothetical protein